MTLKILCAQLVCLTFIFNVSYAKDKDLFNNNSIGEQFYSAPASPTPGYDCNQTISADTSDIIVDNKKICLTGSLSGSLRFEGSGGKLQISGTVNLSSFYSSATANVVIEILDGASFTCSDGVAIYQTTDTLTNWGNLTINNNLSIDGLYRNYDYAYVKKIVNSKTNTIVNTDTLINNNSLDNYGFIHNYGYIKNNWGYISEKLVYGADPIPTLTNYSGAIIDIPNNTCFNSGELTNYGTINAKKLTNKNSATLINTGAFNIIQIIANQTGATIVNSGSIITQDAGYSSIDLEGGSVTNSGTITSATSISNSGPLTNNSTGSITASNGGFSNNATFNNSGTLTVSDNLTNSGTLSNINTGSINALSFIVNQDGGIFTNSATLTTNESIDNYHIFNNSDNITLTECYFSNKDGDAVLNNMGTLTIVDNILYNKGTINNSTEITVTGILYNNTTGIFINENSSTLNVTGSDLVAAYNFDLINYGSITNSGDIQLNGILHNEDGATFTNNSTFNINNANPYNYGTLNNNGNLNINVHFYNYGTYDNIAGTTSVLGYNFYNYSNATNNSNLYVDGNFCNYTGSTFTNNSITETTDGFINNTSLTNAYRLIVGGTLNNGSSSTTTLTNGSFIECNNLYTEGTISSSDYYSSIYIENSTSLKGTISGLVDIFDKTGINLNTASCGPDVVLEDNFTNNVLKLDGSDKYLYVNHSSDLNLSTEGTLEATIKLRNWNSNSYIIQKDGAYCLKMNSTGKQIQCIVQTSGGSVTATNGVNLDTAKWYHIAATWDSKFLYLYVNGILAQKTANSNAVLTSGNTLYIGSKDNTPTALHEGEIDNIRIWNKSFSKDDIWNMFGTSQSSQTNLVLNLTFESSPSTYFTSTTSNLLKAYLSATFNYTSNDLPLDEILQPFTILNKHYTEYDIVYIEPNKRLTIENNVSCNSILVAKNAFLEIPTGFTLSVDDNLYLQSDVDEYALLLQAGTISGDGKMYIEQPFKGDSSWEFKTVPAPVVEFSQFGEIFDEDYGIYYYDQAQRATGGNNSKAWKQATSLQPGIGYIFQLNTPRSVIHTLPLTTFEGASFAQHTISHTTSPNGDGHEGWNLVGNPYNTRISWDKVSNRLNDSYLDLDYEEYVGKAIYVYDQSSNNYSYYVDGVSVNDCDSIIDPFEAFFIKSAANTSNFQINKSLYPSSIATRKMTLNSSKSLAISLKNEIIKDETVIRFAEDATNKYDFYYDAYKFNASTPYCLVYTRLNSNEKLSVNTLPLLNTDTTLTIYTNCSSAGDYTLSFENINSFDAENLYLVDKSANQIINLKEEPTYSFTTSKAGEDMRFILITKPIQTSSLETETRIETSISYHNGTLMFNNNYNGLFSIYNMQGQLVLKDKRISNGHIDLHMPKGIYVVTFNKYAHKITVQ